MRYDAHQLLEALKKDGMRWLVLAFCLITAGCIARGPQFTFQRDENPLNVPEGSIGVIPPVLGNTQVINVGSARMASAHFSIFIAVTPVSQNIVQGEEFRMANSTLAIGAQNLK